MIYLATDNTDETLIFRNRLLSSVKICVNRWLNSSRLFEQLANKLHSSPHTPAYAHLLNRFRPTPCPIARRSRTGNIKPVLARKQIGNHDNCDTGVAVKERVHHYGIKIAFVVEAFAGRD